MDKGKQIQPLDTLIHLPPGSHCSKTLNHLSRSTLAQLALDWLATTPRQVAQDDSDDQGPDEVHETLQKRRALYEGLRDLEGNGGRSKVIKAIQDDWRDGLTYRQVAQLDFKHFEEKGTGRSWTAFRANLSSPAAPIASSAQLFTRFSAAFSAYHTHYLHLSTLPSPHALTILRIQLLPSPSSTTSSSQSHPPALFLLHLPVTPFFLLPSSLSSSIRPILLHCLSAAVSCGCVSAPLEEVQLRGKDWKGLREVLLGRASAVGEWRALRGENGRERDGGGVLVPKERRRVRVREDDGADAENDPTRLPPTIDERRAARDKRRRVGEVEAVFGAVGADPGPLSRPQPPEERALEEAGKKDDKDDKQEEEDLPVLERLDYTVDLPYPSLPLFPPPSSSQPLTLSFPHDPSHPPLTLRFEGPHVLSGLRALVNLDYTQGKEKGKKAKQEPGLPAWLGEVAGEGVNKLRVGRRRDGTVGRV
ncbi:hypothetical protein JCM8547_006780 [Rhodosporidiobolus lusitaniae]